MSAGAPTELDTIYAPIQEEMDRVGRFLQEEFEETEPFIYEILTHIARFRGKQLRPALLFLMNRFAGGAVSEDLIKIGAVIELIHTATLVHDDLLDDALLRRNTETVHRRWGDRAAVLIGDFIYSRAFQLSTEVPGMAQVLSKTTHTICEGELLQIGYRYVPEISEETYFEIIRKKTAVLHAVACELGGVFAGAATPILGRLREFGLDIGMAFQIVDDCLDYAGEEEIAGKSLGTDLRQGKVTLPLIYLRQSAGPREVTWLRHALSGPLDAEAERRIGALVRANGAVPEALSRAGGYVESAKAKLRHLAAEAEAPEFRRDVLESLDTVADYVLRRQR